MFKCLVILKKSPFYILAIDEEEAKEICLKYKQNIIGIASSEKEFIFKEIKESIEFICPEVKMIEQITDEDGEEENVQIFRNIISET